MLQALVPPGFQQPRLVNAAMDTPGSFQDRVKVLARAVFESASSKPLFWRFIHGVIWAPPGTALPQTESCTQFYDGAGARIPRGTANARSYLALFEVAEDSPKTSV